MFLGLLIILAPLTLGYLIPVRQLSALRFIHRLLGWMVYIILFFMGISLAFLDDIAANLLTILYFSIVTASIIILCNILALLLLERLRPWQHKHQHQQRTSRLAMACGSLTLCGAVIVGFLCGLTGFEFMRYATEASEYALIFLLFLIGIQLRGSDMSIRQIILNRRGLMIAMTVFISSMLAGLMNALLLSLPIKTALAMASGFGWYSLSGILMTESFGPVIGSASFFNDLIRELFAIMLIPTLIVRQRSMAVGLSGATSMDFALPVLQRSGGIAIVPAAIVHGFILSLLAPVLIAFFTA